MISNKGDEVDENFKSSFLSSAELMKDKLGDALCLAKWKQVSLHLTTGLNNSCYHPPLHQIPLSELKNNPSALHNTQLKKDTRKAMLNGVKPDECQYCWRMEANGNLSDRHYRSGEPWAKKDFNEIISSSPCKDITPSYVEVNFNHACNLKCSYCSPQFSSTWMQEVKELGGYPTSTTHNDLTHFSGNRIPIPHGQDNPYVDAFWEWWPELYQELEHFRMTGGEPLMDKNTYKVFDYVLENPKSNLHLNVTSNFSVEEKLWQKYLGYVKQLCDGRIEHFMQYVSIDTWGEQAEYLRNGLDFDLLWNRVNQFLKEVPSYNSITFIVTMNNLSVSGFGQLLEGIKELRREYNDTYQRIWFDMPVLRSPLWQSMQLLPEPYIAKMKSYQKWMEDNIETEHTRFRGFKDYEIQKMERDINWMSEPLDKHYADNQKADFYRFFNEHDKRRGTNFLETFPEMRTFWDECKYHAQY
jgi:organic radical activating enzyme